MYSVLLNLFFAINILAKESNLEKVESRVFCRYNYEGVTEVYDPAYFDEKGKVVYAKTIEEYAKVLGPSWYGVSWCDNSTMVNSIGVYYDISNIQHKLRRRDNQTPIENSPLEASASDNPFSRGESTIEEYKNRTNAYIDRIYEKLKSSNQQCIPLVSQNPKFNPYHSSLIIGVDHPPNIRHATGGNFKISNSYNDIITTIPQGVTKCASVSHCEGCSVVCNVLISASNEKQYSITNSNGNVSTHTIGEVNSNTDTLTDEISNTIEVASTLTKSDSITQNESDANTNSLEVAVSIAHSESKTSTDENSTTHTNEHSEAVIHGVTEDDTHAITDTEGETNEQNWSYYKEHSGTKEYSHLSKDDYDYYNNQYEEIRKPKHVKSKHEKRQLASIIKSGIKAAAKAFNKVFKTGGKSAANAAEEFAINNIRLGLIGEIEGGDEEDLGLTKEELIEKYGEENVQEITVLDLRVNDPTSGSHLKYKIKEGALNNGTNKRSVTGGKGGSVGKTGNTGKPATGNQNTVKNNGKNNVKDNKKSGNNDGFDYLQKTTDTAFNGAQAGIAYESMQQEKEIADREHNQTESWNIWNYWQTENWNNKTYDQTERWNNWNYWQTENWNNKTYDQTERWNNWNYWQTEEWNDKNYKQTEK